MCSVNLVLHFIKGVLKFHLSAPFLCKAFNQNENDVINVGFFKGFLFFQNVFSIKGKGGGREEERKE